MDWIPGTWRKWIYGPLKIEGSVVVCPSCKSGMSIGGGKTFGSCHTIDTNGVVNPSVVCPHCSWHVFLRLINWPTEVRGQILVY